MTSGKAQVLFDAAAIAARVEAMAAEVSRQNLQDPLAVPIMTGAFVFAADFLRALHLAGVSPEVDFLQIGSYGAGVRSTGRVELLRDIAARVAGRDVLLIDDILESGRTLSLRKTCFSRAAPAAC